MRRAWKARHRMRLASPAEESVRLAFDNDFAIQRKDKDLV